MFNKRYKLDVLIKSLNIMNKNKFPFLISIVLSLVAVDISVIIRPIVMKRIINAVENQGGELFVNTVVLMTISTLLFWVVLPSTSYITGIINKKTMYQLRINVTNHLMKLPIKYHDETSTGNSLSLLSSDINCIRELFSFHLYKTLENLVIGISGLIMLFIIEWRLAVFATLFGILSVVISNLKNERFAILSSKIQSDISNTTTIFLDIINGIKDVKLFDNREQCRKKMNGSLDRELENKLELASKKSSLITILEFMNGLSIFGIILIGGFMVKRGITDWGSVIAISSLQMATGDLFFKFPISLLNLQGVLAGAERVIKVFEVQEELLDKRIYKVSTNSLIKIEDLSFSYNHKDMIFKDLSLEIRKGEITMIKGPSGCGKSSLIKVILGLYKPDQGIIFLKNKEINNLKEWRDNIAYVPQSASLFAGSIIENITLNNNIDINKVMKICKEVGIHEFITSQKEGYNTILSDNGTSLSVGQRQRLSIARALMKEADILLLDEITSSLDKDNEIKIMNVIKRISKDKAVVMVSHEEINSFDEEIHLNLKCISMDLSISIIPIMEQYKEL